MILLVPSRLRAFLVGLIIAATTFGCTTSDPVSRGRISAFDTTLDITLIGVDRARAAEITRVLEADMQTMQQAWHAWHPGPVQRINEHFNADAAPVPAAPSVLPLLRVAKRLSEQSDGLFNPAIGHLYRAWGFQGRPANCLHPPEPAIVDTVLESMPSMRDVSIDGFRVASSNPLVKLDFRGIALGFAIDQAIARLQELGVHNASISADAGLRAIGSRDGHPWSVPLRGPDGSGLLATVQVRGSEAAFTATASDQRFTWEGREYHDKIDPRTGYPAADTASVTVLHPDATTADAAANALFVAGPKEWPRIARLMGIRYVMLTDRAGRLHMNPAMQARVKLQAKHREVVISEPLT